MRHHLAAGRVSAAVCNQICNSCCRLAADEVDKKLADMRVQLEAEAQKGTLAPQP